MFLTSSISLAWPCWSTGLMAFWSRPTEPGYSILLPNEWAMRKLERKKERYDDHVVHLGKYNSLNPSCYCNTKNKSAVSSCSHAEPAFLDCAALSSIYLTMWHGRVRTEWRTVSAAPLSLGSGFSRPAISWWETRRRRHKEEGLKGISETLVTGFLDMTQFRP